MNKKAIIDPTTKLVLNIVLVDPANVPDFLADCPDATDLAEIGGTYENGVFTPPPATPAPLPSQDEYKNAVDALGEQTARSKGYNSAAHLSGYATSTVPKWASEAAAFISWRDQVWLTAIEILRQVTAGEIEQPTVEGLIASLPAINWPTE